MGPASSQTLDSCGFQSNDANEEAGDEKSDVGSCWISTLDLSPMAKKNGKENRCNFLMFDILESYPNPLKHKTTLAAIVIQGA
jgi:hypothetical protein